MDPSQQPAEVPAQQPRPWPTRLEAAFERAMSRWQLHLVVLTALGFFLGWAVYGVSPLHSLKEISRKQEEDRTRGRMVRRHLDLAGQFLNVLQWEAARSEFEQALRLDPISSEAQLGLFKTQVMESLVEGRRYDPEAIEKRLNLILQERKDDPHALAMMGQLYRRIDREMAMTYYRRAVQVEPKLAGAYAEMGEIYEEESDEDRSLQMYEKALSLSHWNQMYLGNVIDHYQQRGDRQRDEARAQADYRRVTERGELLLQLDPALLSTYIITAQAYLRLGELEQAGKVHERLQRWLERAGVWELKQNRGGWFWNTGERVVMLPAAPVKQSYVRYQIALTEHLRGHEAAAAAQARLAGGLDPRDRADVQHLVRWNLRQIGARQTGLQAQLEAFAAKYLGAG